MTACHFNQNNFCILLKTNTKSDCKCPYYSVVGPAVCSLCGAQTLDKGILESGAAICNNCKSRLGTCAMCEKGHECAFENDPSPLPKTIRQTVQKAGFIMQQDVPNPERIRQTCQNGCSCFREDLGCLKQNGTCENYKER